MHQSRNTKLAGLGPRGLVLLSVLVVLLAVWALFHSQIQHLVALQLLLRAQSPKEESLQQLAAESANPAEFCRACWNTGKVPHRQFVASFLKANAPARPEWFRGVDQLLVEGTLDADSSVRELSLASLQIYQDPRLFQQARAQLNDVDPLVRQLGLDYLRGSDPRQAVSLMIPLLDDPDLRIVARAEVALMRWTGQDFGVRVRLAIHSADGSDGEANEKEDEQKIRQGVARRKQWWAEHAPEYPKVPSHTVVQTSPRCTVGDFVLTGTDGKQIRLADLRGKVVVLNFWATWCTACLTEIPDLAALYRKMGERIAVIGVALDGLPDEHHHDSDGGSESGLHNAGEPLAEIQKKVLRAMKRFDITYPVMLDPTGAVGGRFNGGELPTTVILDASGQMRRRFIGERSLAVFEAMVNEASKP